jgi:ribonucleoside-diphosphate reductase alpha chain
VENAVSKTVNLTANATAATVRATFVAAHRRGCTGVTIYREGSQAGQVLQVLGRCLRCVGEEALPPEHTSLPGGADASP